MQMECALSKWICTQQVIALSGLQVIKPATKVREAQPSVAVIAIPIAVHVVTIVIQLEIKIASLAPTLQMLLLPFIVMALVPALMHPLILELWNSVLGLCQSISAPWSKVCRASGISKFQSAILKKVSPFGPFLMQPARPQLPTSLLIRDAQLVDAVT